MKNLTLSLLKNKIKQKKEKALILLLSVLISVLFVSTITYGATTIGSSIDTGGNLTVSGNATLGDNATDLIKSIGSFNASSTLQATGAARFYSTLQADGLTTLGNASTTNLSSTGNFWLNGNATTTSTGNIQGQGILTMLGTGTSTYSGGLQGTALNITSATASSTFANGIILSKGCFLMPDGTCVGAGGGSGTINSGTTGQLSYYAGSGTTLTATSSLFIHSNQNIGIGTTTPNWLLQIAGVRPFLTLSDTGASADQKHWFLSSQGGNFYVGTSSDAYATSTVSALTINSNGFFGIGTTSPSSKLSVNGSSYFGTGINDTLTIHNGVINYPISATTTISQSVNAWSIATSTSATPIFTINGSNGSAYIQDGTVSLPSLGFFNDNNTGLYRVGIDSLALTAGGVQVMRIDSDQSFYTEKIFAHESALNSLTNLITAVNHSATLGFSASVNAILIGDDLSQGAFHAGLYGTGTSNPKGWYSLIGQRMGGSAWDSTPGALSNGNYLPGIGFAGQSGTSKSNDMEIGAAIHGLIDGTVSAGVLPTSLVFSTTKTNDTGLTERLRITSDGFIGIGTTTPTTMFQVATSTANATTTVEFGKVNQNKGSCLKLYDSVGTVYYCRIDGGTFTCNTTSCE